MKGREMTVVVCRYTGIFLIVAVSFVVHAQTQSAEPEQTDTSSTHSGSRFSRSVLNLFKMAGPEKSKEFHPMAQSERNHLYFSTMINPLSFARCAFSAGI